MYSPFTMDWRVVVPNEGEENVVVPLNNFQSSSNAKVQKFGVKKISYSSMG